MSSAAVDVAVKLTLTDTASAGIAKAAQKAQEDAKQAAEKSSQLAEKHGQKERDSHGRTAKAREALGVRAEKTIQNEINRTEAAYKRLAASGRSSAEDQERAYAAMQRRVTALTNEMGKLTAEQKKQADMAKQMERGRGLLTAGGAGVAALAAGAYVLKAPMQAAMSFDERMAHMSNTAYRERDVRGRKIGMQELESTINRAVQFGGGTRAGAAETLDMLISSGVMKTSEAQSMLPQLMKAASAANADPNQLANIGIRAMQTFRIKSEDMPNVLNMALAAGQAGGFELKDMAKWLPQQMAAATMSGLSGRDGFAKLAALNQAAAITAGTKDEAGNNVVNLLAKINSADTAKDAQKMGINLPQYLQQQRAKGVDSVDAFGALVDKAVQGRSDYKALQVQLKGAKNDDEKRAALEGMSTIAQGAGIGKLIQDRQALMALLGMINNREYMGNVLTEVKKNDVRSGAAIDNNFDLIGGTSAFKTRRAGESMDAAKKAAMDKVSGEEGAIADGISKMATKFPALTGGMTLATTAVGAMAASAAAAAIALRTMSGAPAGGGAITRTLGKAAPYLTAGATLLKGAVAPVAVGAAAGATGYFAGGLGVGKVDKWLAPKGFDSLADWFVGNKQNQPSPQMKATIQVEFADINDRLVARIASQKMEANNVDASFDTGNIHQGAM